MTTHNNPLIGTWKLISAIAINPDGTVESEVYGLNPIGYITYTSEQRMMVMFAKSDRSLLSQEISSPFDPNLQSLSLEEYKQAFLTFNSYAGTYTISKNTVIHHIEIASIPNRVGTDLVRAFTVNGKQITLTTLPTLSDGVLKVFELLWERV